MTGNFTNPKFPSILQILLLALTAPYASADWQDDIGFTRLKELAGLSLPLAPENGVSQIEAFENGSNYIPNTSATRFSGKTFNQLSGSSGISSHANTVATNFYGQESLMPGTMDVDLYSASGWLGAAFLRRNTILTPVVETRAVQNHSWIGADFTDAEIEEINRRLDFAINRDGFICVMGEQNGGGSLPDLLGLGYHGIAVGRSDGLHSRGLTSIDGGGRRKPEIVAPNPSPNTFTSFTTPMVGSTAGLLVATLEAPPFSLPRTSMPRLVKAILLASAKRDSISNWFNTPTDPLNPVYGAGVLNAWQAYDLALGGLQTNGSSSWVHSSVGAQTTVNHFFQISNPSLGSFGAALIWHRKVEKGEMSNNWSSTFHNLDLKLHHANGSEIGDPVVVSTSMVETIELIHQTTLAPGAYALVVSNDAEEAVTYALAWHTVPTITLSATDTTLSESDGSSGSISISRSGPLGLPLKVVLETSGTAIEGSHYHPLPDDLVIPAGQASVNLTVMPVSDNLAQGHRMIELSAAPDFSHASSASVQLTIEDKPYDQWRFDEFPTLEQNDLAISAPNEDPDFDQLPNLLEYAFGLNPKLPNPSPITFDRSGTHLTISSPKNPNAYDLQWSAEVADAQFHWQTAITTEDTTSLFTARDTETIPENDLRLIRIKVVKP